MSYTLIERKELTEAASSISFENIPQFYTDLVIALSGRCTLSAANYSFLLNFNGDGGSNYTQRRLYGAGSGTPQSDGATNNTIPATINGGAETANTFSNYQFYIPNYSGSTTKSVSMEGISENNATLAYQFLGAYLWNNTNGISTVTFTLNGVSNTWVAGSSISLYGINRQQAIGAPKAIGGQITFANGYWYHAFTGSGTFTTQQNLDVDALIIAGGGAGGPGGGGGGGAGGVVLQSAIFNAGSTPVLVGAGAARTVYVNTTTDTRASGNNSQLTGFTTAIGGGGGGFDSNESVINADNGLPGGSGGGGAIDSNTRAAGTAGQGNQGGIGRRGNNDILSSGGGGGAGGAGIDAGFSLNTSGPGGPGIFLPSWAQSTSTGVSSFYAGGGAGSNWTAGSVAGGSGGGGSSTIGFLGVDGVTNTGSGGGANGGAGGSGIVIIRYKA